MLVWAASAAASPSAPLPKQLPGPLLNQLQALHREEQRVSCDQRVAGVKALVAVRQCSQAHEMLHEFVMVGLDADDVNDPFT